MENQLIIVVFQWVLSFGLGLTILYVGYWVTVQLLKFYLKQEIDVTTNSSIAIMVSGILVVIGYMLEGTLGPISECVRLLIGKGYQSTSLYMELGKYLALLLGLALSSSLLSCGLGFWIFAVMTRNVDERQELMSDNWRVGLITAVLLLIIAVITRNQMIQFMEALLPYPDVPGFY